jgi:F-type H+-transporting ATPase subunit gamma
MANQKEIRTRIATVKSTQKITRAMKMVAAARLNRAQSRIQAMRPYALETERVLKAVVEAAKGLETEDELIHPFLARREEKRVALLVVTSDRGLCGAFNTNVLRRAEALRQEYLGQGKEVVLFIIGRKAKEFFARRHVPVKEYFQGLWDNLSLEQARTVARALLRPFLECEIDAIYLVYTEFKSAMTQIVRSQALLPVLELPGEPNEPNKSSEANAEPVVDYLIEPSRDSLLEVLVPMYIEVTILRALFDSTASELGARMTAMDSATNNATDMIGQLTLEYNRARQAAITTELMEIIGGSEALNG